jgi:hypothetical protein
MEDVYARFQLRPLLAQSWIKLFKLQQVLSVSQTLNDLQ